MHELRSYNGLMFGHVPWAMTQNQRGPTCGMTAISVAYRILTGWTIFPTKGHYRDFYNQLYNVKLTKGHEKAYVLRRAAKDLQHTKAGEIVNADSLVKLVDLCEGVRAKVVSFEPSTVVGQSVGQSFVEAIREEMEGGNVPIVLFHVGYTGTEGHYEPKRGQTHRHWVAIFGVEDGGRSWRHLDVRNVEGQIPLQFTGHDMQPNDLLVWNWGRPYIVGGVELGESSALSIDWVTDPRMWKKQSGKPGKLAWLELGPGDTEYRVGLNEPNVRYTKERPTRDLDLRGYVSVSVKK